MCDNSIVWHHQDVDECACIVIYDELFVQIDYVKCNNLLKLRIVKIEK